MGDDLRPAFAQVVGVGREGGLHADFDGFEGAEEDVGDELCCCGSAEVDDCFGGVGEELFAVVVFEGLVGAVFAGALEGVADEGWGLGVSVLVSGDDVACLLAGSCNSYPTEEDAADTFFCHNGAPCLEVGLVDFRVDLTAAFYEVEGGDGGVGWAAGWGEGISRCCLVVYLESSNWYQ